MIYLTGLYAGLITTKITKLIFFQYIVLLLRNNIPGPVNLVNLAWTSRPQYLFKKYFFDFYIQPRQISEKIFFKWLSYLFWVKIRCSVHKHYFYVFYISTLFLLHVFFLIFFSVDWFRFQKTLANGPFRTPRYQDFWDKSLWWFLGSQFTFIQLQSPFCTPQLLFSHQSQCCLSATCWCSLEGGV